MEIILKDLAHYYCTCPHGFKSLALYKLPKQTVHMEKDWDWTNLKGIPTSTNDLTSVFIVKCTLLIKLLSQSNCYPAIFSSLMKNHDS